MTKIGLRPADLEAQLARESGDLTRDDQEGDIAGIAQLSSDEEKLAGGAKGDRKKPKKAIVLAAKAMANKAAVLKALSTKPTGLEWKKFLFAAYNAGPYAIITAQKLAVADQKTGDTWDELIAGGDQSYFRKALNKHYGSKPPPDQKFAETTQYVRDIVAKLVP